MSSARSVIPSSGASKHSKRPGRPPSTSRWHSRQSRLAVRPSKRFEDSLKSNHPTLLRHTHKPFAQEDFLPLSNSKRTQVTRQPSSEERVENFLSRYRACIASQQPARNASLPASFPTIEDKRQEFLLRHRLSLEAKRDEETRKKAEVENRRAEFIKRWEKLNGVGKAVTIDK